MQVSKRLYSSSIFHICRALLEALRRIPLVSPLVGGANAFMLGSYIRAEGVQSEKQALLRIRLWASYYVAVFTLLNSQPFGMPLSLPHYKHYGIGRCGSRCSTKKVDMARIMVARIVVARTVVARIVVARIVVARIVVARTVVVRIVVARIVVARIVVARTVVARIVVARTVVARIVAARIVAARIVVRSVTQWEPSFGSRFGVPYFGSVWGPIFGPEPQFGL
jgi:hypothetical protein